MSTGLSASITVTIGGASASAYGQEVDLAIDAGGDLLQIDPGGDVLIVTPSMMTFTGATASFVVADRAVTLEGEGWSYFETEGGQALESEGT